MYPEYYIQHGTACFSPELTEIPSYAFAGRKDLRHAHIPGHVLTIGPRSFENCVNLKTLILDEGIESIDMEAFLGCKSLESVVVPNSADVTNYVFYGCDGLLEPVFSRDKTILYAYPNQKEDPIYQLPEGTQIVGCTAFGPNPFLKEVIFPEGFREFHIRAFCDSHVRRVVLPDSLKKLPEGVFENCQSLTELILPAQDTVIEPNFFKHMPKAPDILRQLPFPLTATACQSPFWGMKQLFLPVFYSPQQDYTRNPYFRKICKGCSQGNPEAMETLADFFLSRNEATPHEFYRYAAFLWTQRAQAQRQGRLPSPARQWDQARRSGFLPGKSSGRFLRYLGFLFFDADRVYMPYQFYPDTEVMLVYSPCVSTRDPHDKGTSHDWYFLTPELTLLSPEHCIPHCTRWIPEEEPEEFLLVQKKVDAALAERNAR